MVKRVLILGSTGSIGEQALEVIASSSELIVCGLSADHSWERLVEQARSTSAGAVALADPEAAARAAAELDGARVLAGEQGVIGLIEAAKPDLVLNAIVGTAGLGPTIATLSAGIDLALANKESLVVGGNLVTTLAEATEAEIIPVDSEHSALYQLLA
ncbi:MAG: 1-deoxy-D-xylulose-5-phosphate reductoisomerase, partial [Solirubrobacterales bacterium]